MTDVFSGARANPLAGNPLATKADLQRAVHDLVAPLRPYTSPGGARVRLGSFGAAFEEESAELEGFARPLYGIVPLTVGGGTFDAWDRICDGLGAGSDPNHPEYWAPIERDGDQRMVEQAAIGLALAFCPEHAWEPLDQQAKDDLVHWLKGIERHDPVANNWQFFRVLVSLGLERVGAPVDRGAVDASLALLDSYRRGEHWYVDGDLANVDYYVPMAFHTYGLMYAAANDLGLGDDTWAERFRERAHGFAADFAHWFGPDGSAVALGRSLTYRFATSSFWGALAWADVEPEMGWAAVRGLSLRNLRWFADKPISDRDGVLSVGYAYDNRVLCESYNSAGSPYWCMKSFAALAAGDDHPFWTTVEAPLEATAAPVVLGDAGWLVRRDERSATALVANPGLPIAMPEQAAAKYRKFAYSSSFAFTGDVPDFVGRIATDSTLVCRDGNGNRLPRLAVEAAGVEVADGMPVAWSTWHPDRETRIDTVCWFDPDDARWHGRLHRLRNARELGTTESGWALGCAVTDSGRGLLTSGDAEHRSTIVTPSGCSSIIDLDAGGGRRAGEAHVSAVNANLRWPHSVVPVLRGRYTPGDHRLACVVFGDPGADSPSSGPTTIPPAIDTVLARISAA